MSNRQPLISFTVQGCNDGYMGNFLWRLSTCLNKISLNFASLGRLDDIEILVSDWGSPQIPLRDALPLNHEARQVAWFFYVQPDAAIRYNRDCKFNHPVAANIPIRRARGEFIFYMDSDAYMPLETALLLLDIVDRKGPPGVDPGQSFFDMSRRHVPNEFVVKNPTIEEVDELIRNHPEKLIQTVMCNVERYRGSGAGFFGKKEMYHRIRGWNEEMIHWGWTDVDMHYRFAMFYRPCDFWKLGGKMYHLEHYAKRGQIVGNRKLNAMEMPTRAIVNGPNWGLADQSIEISGPSTDGVDLKNENAGRPLPVKKDLSKARNFIISGTNFWNPGDDFVRDGVIHVLHAIFPGEQINLHFYNFNADQFPKSKFRGIGNELAAVDLGMYRDFVDGVIVAGLSAGCEIKDLYRWIIANRLEDRVCLIGAGYENSYCAEHVTQEPETSIFQKARIIIGRTEKHPAFIGQEEAPYHHLNCPSVLCVKKIKTIPDGKKIERIGFSIQLSRGVGIPNQATGESVSKLAVEILFDLAKTHAVEVVAHHKTEYFYFLHLLKNTGIPVVYSSFYQDLFEVYPRYDLVITTRLHASLFANGHGIPGIIVNDTDRHTHTLAGFPHSAWVNNRQRFDEEFARVQKLDLSSVAREMEQFKESLMKRYVEALKPAFESNHSSKPSVSVKKKDNLPSIQGPQNLPVHFFTIVLNGEPFIHHPIGEFQKLPFPWHWHLVEGVADLKHDTAWSLGRGGHIDPSQHRDGLSVDGTSAYLDDLKKKYPDQITLYRKPEGAFWDGKLEMVNAPLSNIPEECLLWQVDSDELWTADQIKTVHALFRDDPARSAAYYYCHFFVGKDLVISTRNTYGNRGAEWLRTWRFRPGDRWQSHEPPCLVRNGPEGWRKVEDLNPFRNTETEKHGLVFQHYAYATENQLRHKESYYGYKSAVKQWKRLQAVKNTPVPLGAYLNWIDDGAVAERIDQLKIKPLFFGKEAEKSVKNVALQGEKEPWVMVRSDTYGDLILFLPVLKAIYAREPDRIVYLVIRGNYADLGVFFPPNVRVITTSIDPFLRAPSNCEMERKALEKALAEIRAGRVIAAAFARTWLDMLVCGLYPEEKRVSLGGAPLKNIWFDELGLKRRRLDEFFGFILSVDQQACEWEKNERLAGYLLGGAFPFRQALDISKDLMKQGAFLLEKSGLKGKPWVACCPAGTANISIKSWPADRFAEVSAWLKHEKGMDVLLLGHESEEACLKTVQEGCRCRGVDAALWLGRKGEFSLLCALIAKSALYLGNDSGPMHAAAALDIPTVAIFGGGHWPRFKPVTERSIAVVCPMPCFGCQWDCFFQDAPCVRSIAVEDVKGAVEEVLDAGEKPFQREWIGRSGPEPMEALFQKVFRQRADLRERIAALKNGCWKAEEKGAGHPEGDLLRQFQVQAMKEKLKRKAQRENG